MAVRPFQGPIKTVIGPFYPRGPSRSGVRGGLRRLSDTQLWTIVKDMAVLKVLAP